MEIQPTEDVLSATPIVTLAQEQERMLAQHVRLQLTNTSHRLVKQFVQPKHGPRLHQNNASIASPIVPVAQDQPTEIARPVSLVDTTRLIPALVKSVALQMDTSQLKHQPKFVQLVTATVSHVMDLQQQIA